MVIDPLRILKGDWIPASIECSVAASLVIDPLRILKGFNYPGIRLVCVASLVIDPLRILKGMAEMTAELRKFSFIGYRSAEDTERRVKQIVRVANPGLHWLSIR